MNSFLIRLMLLMLPSSVQADKHLWVNASILLVHVNIGMAKSPRLRNDATPQPATHPRRDAGKAFGGPGLEYFRERSRPADHEKTILGSGWQRQCCGAAGEFRGSSREARREGGKEQRFGRGREQRKRAAIE
jgi:hypothetical protein